jgi:Transposase IS66 family
MRDAWRCVRPGRDPSSTTPMPIWNESGPRCCRRVLKGKPSPTRCQTGSAKSTSAKTATRKSTNNGAERSLRGVAVGRKNWVFLEVITAAGRGSDQHHHVQTARHDPFAYLRDIFEHSAHTGSQLVELFPDKWMVARRCASAAMG